MLQLSGSSVTGMYVSLLWLIVFGVVAGIQGGFWNDGWFWISIGLLVLAVGEMSAVARPYYQRVKEAVEVRPSGVPRRSDEELEEILRSPVALWNAVFGVAVLLAITWLMIFKPFQVLLRARRYRSVGASGRSAGPATTWPVAEYREPWHGQSQPCSDGVPLHRAARVRALGRHRRDLALLVAVDRHLVVGRS